MKFNRNNIKLFCTLPYNPTNQSWLGPYNQSLCLWCNRHKIYAQNVKVCPIFQTIPTYTKSANCIFRLYLHRHPTFKLLNTYDLSTVQSFIPHELWLSWLLIFKTVVLFWLLGILLNIYDYIWHAFSTWAPVYTSSKRQSLLHAIAKEFCAWAWNRLWNILTSVYITIL
jgi:hypothetical protein